MTLFFLGDYAEAQTHCEQGMTLIDPTAQPGPGTLPTAQHPG